MMRQFKKIWLLTLVLLQSVLMYAAADLVVYSYNRPMQLYAFLESVKELVTGLAEVHVIYRSDAVYDAAYQEVFAHFPGVQAHKQGRNPHADFKLLTLQCAFESKTPYIVFAVDDIIVKDFINFDECVQLLERYEAYGVYFRLGKNLNHAYTVNQAQALPPLQELEPGVFAWRLGDGDIDWGYPNTVDMTLYRKSDIKNDIQGLHYTAPNNFEGNWSGRAPTVSNRRGVCFARSKIVNVPLNRVQTVWPNRHMNFLTPQEMLELFKQGLKIDIKPFYLIDNKSAHMEYTPIFIKR